MARHPRVVVAARLLPLLLLLTLPAVVQAQFNYTTDNGTITITGYTGPGGAVTIPSTINGLPVTRIGDYAFWGNTSLISVTIPNSVTSIEYAAFFRCNSLTSVTIPNSVTSIEYAAFADCTSLTAITVDALNSAYSSVDAVLFDKSQTMLILYPGGKAGSDYTISNSVTSIADSAFRYNTSLTKVAIGNSVTSIGDLAFYYCTSLTSVTLGNGVTYIGRSAFSGCTSLTSVTIPNSVTYIGRLAFADCTSLTSVTIPNSVTNIEWYAFEACTSLISVTIPNSVTSIGDNAFYDCTSLTNITIPNSVTNIGAWAFTHCTSLTSVTIPNNVTSIGAGAFIHCTSLTAITVDALNSAYNTVDGVLFNKSQTTLIQYPGGKAGSYTIPNSVADIGSAFFGCTRLTSITIPNSVTSIGDSAFSFCTSLTGVYFQGNPPSVDLNAFNGANKTTVYYLPGTTGWGATFAGRPTAQWLPEARTSDADFGVRTNQFGFNIRWASDKVVVVEASPDLSNPVWTPVSTNTLTGGSSYFSDRRWTNDAAHFYRLRSP